MSSTGENIHHYIKMETIIEANNQFTVDLVKRLSGNENVLFSPLSIISALAMVFLGTNCKTSTRIEKILHLENDKDLNSELRKLVDLIQGSEDYQVFITNGMFVEQALNISEEHKKDVKKWYNSEIKKINFSNSELVRQDINTWVEEQTRGRIQNLLPKNSTFSKSKVIAINTIYLLANWTDDLPEYKTQKALFTISTNKKVPVDMMSTMGMFNYRYIHDQKIRILELPYGKNKQLSMYIILPEEQINLAVLTQNVSYEHITNWTNSGLMEKKYVKLYLPRFTIDYTTVLNKMFPSLEISDVLTRMTNVSELAKNKMSTLGIFHNAWLKVDEEGTEKASEETEKVLEIAVILPEIVFKIDHPFIFMLKQKINNCILFFGRFQSPGE